MKIFFNFQFLSATTRLNNILRLATLAAACFALPTHALAQSSCPADLNGDGVVNILDANIATTAFGSCPTSCPADLNGDRVVNGFDVVLIVQAYGNCPVAAPTINDVSPPNRPTSGGMPITITGTNFTGASVMVGGVAATSVVVNSAGTSLTAVTPSGAVGLATVTVTTAGGTATRAGAFRYFDSSWYTVLEQDPSASVTNATVRANIIATGFPWRVGDIGTGIELLLVPPGTFTMGCNAFDLGGCAPYESPRHQVTLTRAFYLGKYEVTQAQWQARMGNNPSHFSRNNPNRPVELVSWNDVAGFNTATGFRLPTEAEWEYSCRAGTTRAIHYTSRQHPNGSNSTVYLYNIAWFNGNAAARTHNVGGKDPNGFGFYDMSGNVMEWCNDWYGATYYSASPSTDPAGPSTGTSRVLRGGGWFDYSDRCRSSFRYRNVPDFRIGHVGFRVARTP